MIDAPAKISSGAVMHSGRAKGYYTDIYSESEVVRKCHRKRKESLA
jgi:hypothetical protein